MTKPMRAKLVVHAVERFATSEKLHLRAVCKNDGPYPADGLDENNTFAKFSPQADMTLHVCNPALIGAYDPGDAFYVDFTPVPASA